MVRLTIHSDKGKDVVSDEKGIHIEDTKNGVNERFNNIKDALKWMREQKPDSKDSTVFPKDS
jgi:hypothetical protein